MGGRGKPVATRMRQARLAWLYGEHQKELQIFVERSLGQTDGDVEDLVQEAFIKFERYADEREIGNPRALLYSIARTLILDRYRRNRVVNDFAREVRHSWDLATFRNNPAYSLLGRQMVALFDEALAAMPERRRRMILMNRVENLSCEEISRKLGVSNSTVQKEIVKGMAECRKHLAPERIEDFEVYDKAGVAAA